MQFDGEDLRQESKKKPIQVAPGWPLLYFSVDYADLMYEYRRIIPESLAPVIRYSKDHPRRIEEGIKQEENFQDRTYILQKEEGHR